MRRQRYPKAGIGAWHTASYVDCGQRATSQRSRWARAHERFAASNPREEETQPEERSKYYVNITGHAGQTTSEIGNSLAGSGRRRVGLESHRPGRSWTRDLNISRAGPDPAQPHLRVLAPAAKTVGFEIFDFFTN